MSGVNIYTSCHFVFVPTAPCQCSEQQMGCEWWQLFYFEEEDKGVKGIRWEQRNGNERVSVYWLLSCWLGARLLSGHVFISMCVLEVVFICVSMCIHSCLTGGQYIWFRELLSNHGCYVITLSHAFKVQLIWGSSLPGSQWWPILSASLNILSKFYFELNYIYLLNKTTKAVVLTNDFECSSFHMKGSPMEKA